MHTEYLDYCRVKKIFEKGFGFLTSLYLPENVFFHFSKIRDKAAKEKLQKLKRGEVYLFYTSKINQGKRRVDKIWLDVKEVDAKLITPFILRIIEELKSGKINIFELAHVVLLLREAGYINKNQFEKILNTSKVIRFPKSVFKMLTADELNNFDNPDQLADNMSSGELTWQEFKELVMIKVYGTDTI